MTVVFEALPLVFEILKALVPDDVWRMLRVWNNSAICYSRLRALRNDHMIGS
jgi:hypothetical protein